jgi:hypothetical protein
LPGARYVDGRRNVSTQNHGAVVVGSKPTRLLTLRKDPDLEKGFHSLTGIDADCAGLLKTPRHTSLKLARCRRMQALISSTSGISDE